MLLGKGGCWCRRVGIGLFTLHGEDGRIDKMTVLADTFLVADFHSGAHRHLTVLFDKIIYISGPVMC